MTATNLKAIGEAAQGALESLKRRAKPIPFAANDDVVGELRNLRTLLKAERFHEATERLDRLFDMKLLEDFERDVIDELDEAKATAEELAGAVESAESEIARLEEEIDELEVKVEKLEEKLEALTEQGGTA